MTENDNKVALVAGGSGLVGSRLLRLICEAPEYQRVYALSRRPLGFEHPRLANRIVPFDRLAAQLKGLVCHDAFCTLGTTMRAAGSEAAFRAVDHDAVVAFARAARAAGAQRFVVVSAIGADPESGNLYQRVKGETEDALAGLGFPSLDILRPSLLLGPRSEMRPLELAARMLAPIASPFLHGSLQPWRAIQAEDVARAMLGAARSGRRGVYRYTWSGLKALAGGRPAPPSA
jgi:uncharacterized protein YbjT (DUF2867 family)